MDRRDLLRLWGKTDRKNPANFHPLLFHLLDVAHCAVVLWNILPSSLRRRMADAVKLDEDTAGVFYALLAGLHDLGKAYPNFQKQAPQFLDALTAVGFDFPENTWNAPHNFVSVPEVQRLFADLLLFPQALAEDVSMTLTYILGAHHGIFPHTQDLSAHKINAQTLGRNPQWQEARNSLAEILCDALKGSRSATPPVTLTAMSDPAYPPLLAAFISLADWFGSSSYFPMQGIQDITTYVAQSRLRAYEAVTKSGWTLPTVIRADEPVKPFTELFAYLDTAKVIEPRDLQKCVGSLLNGVHTPALWIIEEEMGSGKTEAAFSIFDDCHRKGLAHGVYIAMPTQATSNAMFVRLGDFLTQGRGEKDVNLILAHSHALLDPDYRDRMKRAEAFETTVYNEPEDKSADAAEDGALLVRSWFTARKQTLLSHYGVGTIDQSLMGVLQTRHWFVRLYGLAGKVVVFDEVHAYDAYMNTLLVQLIRWLTLLDCTVVILSATLPKKTRLELAKAYRKTAKSELELQRDSPAYPRVTLVPQKDTACAYPIRSIAETCGKTVALSLLPNTPEAAKKAILDAVPGKGCAILICNTVARAMEMYEALHTQFEEKGWECLLFHARAPFAWRKAKETDVLERFGKASGSNRMEPRPNTLLIATQVVQESLDLDADFMLSEMAPIDLILQRMGRLYRHDRVRDTTTAGPRLALLCDVEGEMSLPNFGGSAFVYAPYILLRSWLVLREKTQIVIPHEIEPLVQAVYDNPTPTDLDDEWTEELARAKILQESEKTEQRKHALDVSILPMRPEHTLYDWFSSLKPGLKDDDDPQLHKSLKALTRDGDPSITVVCCGTATDGKALAPDPKGKIPAETVIEMMQFSLPLSHKSLYYVLAGEETPSNWQHDAHLRHCRRIIFKNGTAEVGKTNLILSKTKGLEIEGGVKAEVKEQE